ncbi:MAG: phospholipase D family protein [Alphaproteobacteria bacterium]|nr:phospholipase D family protein [Alphaproteobacteria bacterium]
MTELVFIIAAAVAVALLACTAAAYSYGRFAARAKGAPSVALPVTDGGTPLDTAVARLTGARGDESGLMLLDDNLEAFAARVVSARKAGRSLDLMYYIWKNDLTGRLVVHELLEAADRGVRVRLLLDDVSARGRDRAYLALHSHPNISVRLFNPSRAREGVLRRGVEMALRAVSQTRRMHNKAWIADGRLAIVGGRNIGDAYFDAARTANFRDLDLVLVGPAVGQAEAVFDSFWNSDAVIPIDALIGRHPARLGRLRRRLSALAAGAAARPYVERIRERVSAPEIADLAGRIHWTADARIVSDPPEKAAGRSHDEWLMRSLAPVIDASRQTLEIVSPYFIPGDDGAAGLAALVARGVDVAVLTNSLAATDVAAVHGAYARYRRPLLEAGVRLYELQPYVRGRRISVFGSSGASLHTKAFTVDGRAGFVGSFNFDPRSASLNTEMGVLFEHPGLAAEMRDRFRQETAAEASYALSLSGSGLQWDCIRDGQRRSFRRDPNAGPGRRILAGLVGLLPIQSQL